MNRKPLTSVLLILVLAAVLAPTAAPAPRAYTAGHFALEVGGQFVYDGPGELLSESSIVLRGAPTSNLGSWALSAARFDAYLVEFEGTRVLRYRLTNAWPKLDGDAVTLHYEALVPAD